MMQMACSLVTHYKLVMANPPIPKLSYWVRVRLPRDQWPQAWIDAGYEDPACPLILALYGHPDAGTFWERHCEAKLIEVGFIRVPEWPSVFYHPKYRLFLVVYVDDFKMSGPSESLYDRMGPHWSAHHDGGARYPKAVSGLRA